MTQGLVTPSSTPLHHLQRRWRQLLLIHVAVLLALYLLLRNGATELALPLGWAERWALQAGVVLGVEMYILQRHLHLNHAQTGEPLYATLGWGNALTLARGVAYAWMAGFLFAPRPGGLLDWVPAGLYLFASIADYLDGYLARATGHVTELGQVLDMEFDGLGMLIAVGLAVQYGRLPALFLLVAFARPLFVGGMAWRAHRGLPNHPLPESDRRRLFAGLLMGFVAVVLWPVFAPPATYIAAGVFGLPVAMGFLRDWCVVAGWISPRSPGYQRWRRRLESLFFAWMPLLLRVAAGPGAVWVLGSLMHAQTARPAAGVLALAVALGVVGAAGAILGCAPRLAGICLAGLAMLHLLVLGQGPANWTLLGVAGLLVELGGGRFALWTPEERWLRRRGGADGPDSSQGAA